VALLGLVAQVWAADTEATAPRAGLDSNEALFTVLSAINYCWFDLELSASDPLRAQIRAEVAKTIDASPEAQESSKAMCQFYTEHLQTDPARTLAQYVSLGLNLTPPPALTLNV
jgi:hypothetical protein